MYFQSFEWILVYNNLCILINCWLNYGIIILDHAFLLSYFALQVFSIETSRAYPKKILFLGVGRAGGGAREKSTKRLRTKTFYPKTP